MSMILEALSRAEKERQTDQGNHLDTAKYVTSSTIKEDRFKKWVLVALAANFILVLLVSVGYLWNSYSTKSKQSADTQLAVDTQQPQVELINAQTTTSALASQDLTQQIITQEPAKSINSNPSDNASTAVASLESEAHIKNETPLSTKTSKKVVTKKVAKKIPPVQYSSQPLTQAATNKQPDIAAISQSIARDTQVSSVNNYAPSSYMKLSDMSVAERAQLSQLEVNVHVYDDRPQSRFVLINMVKYKEGDRLSGANATVSSIVPEGVVLNYANQQVLIERNK